MLRSKMCVIQIIHSDSHLQCVQTFKELKHKKAKTELKASRKKINYVLIFMLLSIL